MNRNGFLLFCQAMSIVALLCSVAGCIGDEGDGTTVQDDLGLTTSKQDQDSITLVTPSDNTVDEQTADNTLSGTCPKGHHCGSPACPLWTDMNSNDLCDRGE
jgi:hypothetical protein